MLRRQAIAAFRPRPVLETRLRGPSGAPRPRARPNSPRERPLPSANMTLLPAPWALARSHPRTMARTPVAWPMALPPSLILHSFTSTVNAHRWCTSSFTLSLRRRGVTLTFLTFSFSLFFLPYFFPHRSRRVRMHPSPTRRKIVVNFYYLQPFLRSFSVSARSSIRSKNSDDLLRRPVLVDTQRSSLPTTIPIDLEQRSCVIARATRGT